MQQIQFCGRKWRRTSSTHAVEPATRAQIKRPIIGLTCGQLAEEGKPSGLVRLQRRVEGLGVVRVAVAATLTIIGPTALFALFFFFSLPDGGTAWVLSLSHLWRFR